MPDPLVLGEQVVRDNREPKNRLQRSRGMDGIKEDVYSLDEGAVIVQWPEHIQGATAKEIEGWLQLVGSKIKRAIGTNPDPLDEPASVE